MNLIDAIKSGRPFRCKFTPNYGKWITLKGDLDGGDSCNLVKNWDTSGDEISAWHIAHGDWEILEPTVKISRSQLAEAVDSWMREANLGVHRFNDLASKLGLGEP